YHSGTDTCRPIGRPLRGPEQLPYVVCAGLLGAARSTRVRPNGGLRMSLTKGGYAMRTFDLAPLYRSTVGFDRLFSLFDQVAGHDGAPGYPPYNNERTGENGCLPTDAVAGFSGA